MSHRQYMVIGMGRFGSSLAQTLYDMGEDVLAIDQNAQQMEDMRDRVTNAIQADASDPDVLKEIGARDFDVAVVAIGEDVRSSAVITMLLKEMGVPMVVAKAQDEMHGRLLKRLGADKVIYPERDMGRRAAHNIVSGNIVDYMELSREYTMMEIRPRDEWIGRSLKEIQVRERYGVNVIAIRSGERVNGMPGGNDQIDADSVLVILGNRKGLERLGV